MPSWKMWISASDIVSSIPKVIHKGNAKYKPRKKNKLFSGDIVDKSIKSAIFRDFLHDAASSGMSRTKTHVVCFLIVLYAALSDKTIYSEHMASLRRRLADLVCKISNLSIFS